MKFNQIAAAKAKPTILKGEFDFGGDIGKQPIFVRRLKYRERQNTFAGRLSPDGTVRLTGEDNGRFVTAELVAMHLCDEKGNAVTTAAELLEWSGEDVDALNAYIGTLINPEGANTADPSPATS